MNRFTFPAFNWLDDGAETRDDPMLGKRLFIAASVLDWLTVVFSSLSEFLRDITASISLFNLASAILVTFHIIWHEVMTFDVQHVCGRQKSIIFLKEVLKFLVRSTDILLDKSIKFLREK